MKTLVTIQPIPKHARLPGDRQYPSVIEYAGRLSADEVFARVYPGYADLGHTHLSSGNGWCGYTFKYADASN